MDAADRPSEFREYSTVRVSRLIEADRFFSGGADEISREPRVGDEGVVVDRSTYEGRPVYIIECMTDGGDTLWVAEFTHDKLDLVREVGEADGE